MGTISLSDLYGPARQSPAGGQDAPAVNQASGGMDTNKGPAWSWVAMVAVLVGIRVLYEYAG